MCVTVRAGGGGGVGGGGGGGGGGGRIDKRSAQFSYNNYASQKVEPKQNTSSEKEASHIQKLVTLKS